MASSSHVMSSFVPLVKDSVSCVESPSGVSTDYRKSLVSKELGNQITGCLSLECVGADKIVLIVAIIG